MDGQNSKKLGIIIISIASIISLLLITLFIGVLFSLDLFESSRGSGGSSGSACANIKSANEICSSITVEGIGDMSVDEYVAGVVGGEVGVFTGYPEIQKAMSIAARTYSLANATKDGKGKCIVPNGEHFQVYNGDNINDTIIGIVEETSGMILIGEDGNVKSTEYDSILLVEAYDSSGTTVTLKQRNLEISKDWLIKVKEPEVSCPINSSDDKSLNKYRSNNDGYGCGHGRGMSQWGGLYLEMEEGYNYTQILDYFYGEESGYNYTLASTNGLSSVCTSPNNGNLKALSTYTEKHVGLTKLNRTLSTDEIEELNNFINSEVDKAGYGTGEAVATAGQSLVHGLEQKGYYLGYYWGGDRSSIGVGTRWGANVGIAKTRGGSPTGPEFGMDCSAFVSWTIRNACDSSFSSDIAAGFVGYGSKLTSINDAKPGDLLANSGHVILVIKNDGDGTLTAAEESLGNGGLIFKKYDNIGSYHLIDMSNWYSKNCNNSR